MRWTPIGHRIRGSGLCGSGLGERGHETRVIRGWTATFGAPHMIRVEPSGTLTTAADPQRGVRHGVLSAKNLPDMPA